MCIYESRNSISLFCKYTLILALLSTKVEILLVYFAEEKTKIYLYLRK